MGAQKCHHLWASERVPYPLCGLVSSFVKWVTIVPASQGHSKDQESVCTCGRLRAVPGL